MSTTLSPPMQSGPSSPPGQPNRSSNLQPPPAAPPSKSEIERKLSYKSAARPRTGETPKKVKRPHTSGNDSDGSSVSELPGANYPSSPLLTPAPGSIGLTSIAERERRSKGTVGSGEEFVEMELADVEEEGEDAAEVDGEDADSEEVEKEGGDLQKGMEGERMMKSGFLYKKQERRKVWKKKWFVLRSNKLAYYKDEREYSLKRVLDLKSIHTVAPVQVKKHPFTFGIVTSKRTFFAKALSQDEMDDWVRAINTARRRLSEREEEERNRRAGAGAGAGAGPAAPVAMSPRAADKDLAEVHPGTYSSMASSSTGQPGTSPVMGMSDFTSHPGGAAAYPTPTTSSQGMAAIPSSPMDTTNNLTSQMAKMGMPRSPASSASPRFPSTQMSSRVVSGASTRRDPSASSYSSSGDYFNQPGMSQTLSAAATGPGAQMQPSSDEEGSFSDSGQPGTSIPLGTSMSTQASMPMPSAIDPNKVILQAYLMKRSKGRGRKIWRKRWFYLTSQGLTYTKSHMETRPVRFIPLSTVLDALEVDPEDNVSDASDSDGLESGNYSPPSRQFSNTRRLKRDESQRHGDKLGTSGEEHLFRLITSKRTYVLCAPSEEDEIKWLAAFRALLKREREKGSNQSAMLSPPLPSSTAGVLPLITKQPPTPAQGISAPLRSNQPMPPVPEKGPPVSAVPSVPSVPSAPTSQGPPVDSDAARRGSLTSSSGGEQSPVQTLAQRGRSATWIAKGAVADVTKRFHPEGL